jgi:hypothetical protein
LSLQAASPETFGYTLVWTGFKWLVQAPVADLCEHSNEPSGFIKGGEFLDELRQYQILKDFAPWSSSYSFPLVLNIMIKVKVKLSLYFN